MEIRYIAAKETALGEDALDGFVRTQEVRRIYVRENGEYVLRDQLYTEDWSAERKREAARGLCEGGTAAFLAMDGERVAGFTSLIWDAEETGVILLDLIQVDARYRRRGIGRRLFALALEEARRLGAREMRISANHAEETVCFYRAMGAEILPDPPARMTEAEPYDVPMRIFP